MVPPPQTLHEALKPIQWLVGRWTTKNGHGKYPTIPEFHYHEDLMFVCLGQPMLNFLSTSLHPVKETPMHQERGFLRIAQGTNNLAFVVSHNFGMTSVEEGKVDPENKTITLESVSIQRMSFSKPPYATKIKREFQMLNSGALQYVLHMSTEDTPLQEHLRAEYKNVPLNQISSD